MLLLFYVYIIFARINKVRVKQTLNISYTQLTILASFICATACLKLGTISENVTWMAENRNT